MSNLLDIEMQCDSDLEALKMLLNNLCQRAIESTRPEDLTDIMLGFGVYARRAEELIREKTAAIEENTYVCMEKK